MLRFALGLLATSLFVFQDCLVSPFCLCKRTHVSSCCLCSKLFFFYHLKKQSLSRPCLSPGLHIDPLPLCKKCPAGESVFVCAATADIWEIEHVIYVHQIVCSKFLLKGGKKTGREGIGRKVLEIIFLLFRESVFEFIREFTTGQNLGSVKLTSSCACVVSAVWLHEKNIFLFSYAFSKRGLIHKHCSCSCSDFFISAITYFG